MRGECRHCLLALLFLLAVSASPSQSEQAGECTPQICLRAISDALERADAGSFEQSVAIDAILSHAQPVFLSAMAGAGAELSPLLSLALSQAYDAQGLAGPLLHILKSEIRAFVLNGVSSGAFAGKSKSGSQASQGLLAPLFANASTGRKVLRESATPACRVGEDWIMPFELFDEGNRESYHIVGRFSDAAGSCRLIAIENMAELIRRLEEENNALK